MNINFKCDICQILEYNILLAKTKNKQRKIKNLTKKWIPMESKYWMQNG